jgi:hypothetical protein
MSIRERLESITPLLEQPQVQLAPRGDNDPPVTALQNCPPLVLKSPHLMQILGLQSDLASVLYRLENTARQPPVALFESTPAECFHLYLLPGKPLVSQLTLNQNPPPSRRANPSVVPSSPFGIHDTFLRGLRYRVYSIYNIVFITSGHCGFKPDQK